MKVKMTMISYSFNVNEAKKTVTAVVRTQSRIGFYEKDFVAVGIAKCDGKDTFDVEFGKRLAKAKAEREAYVQHKNHLHLILKSFNHEIELLSNKYERAQYYIQHQKDYINSLKQ